MQWQRPEWYLRMADLDTGFVSVLCGEHLAGARWEVLERPDAPRPDEALMFATRAAALEAAAAAADESMHRWRCYVPCPVSPALPSEPEPEPEFSRADLRRMRHIEPQECYAMNEERGLA